MEAQTNHLSYADGEILQTYGIPDRDGDTVIFFKVLHSTPDDRGVIAIRIGTRIISVKDEPQAITTVKAPDPDNALSKPFFMKYGYGGVPVFWDDWRKRYLSLERTGTDFTYIRINGKMNRY